MSFPFHQSPPKLRAPGRSRNEQPNAEQTMLRHRMRKGLGKCWETKGLKRRWRYHEQDSPDVHLLGDGLVPYHLWGHPRHCPRKGHFGTLVTELFRCTKIWNLYCICVCNQNTRKRKKNKSSLFCDFSCTTTATEVNSLLINTASWWGHTAHKCHTKENILYFPQ